MTDTKIWILDGLCPTYTYRYLEKYFLNPCIRFNLCLSLCNMKEKQYCLTAFQSCSLCLKCFVMLCPAYIFMVHRGISINLCKVTMVWESVEFKNDSSFVLLQGFIRLIFLSWLRSASFERFSSDPYTLLPIDGLYDCLTKPAEAWRWPPYLFCPF